MGFTDYISSGRLFTRSRSETRIANLLGIVPGSVDADEKKYRSTKLEVLEAYYENRQYSHLVPWEMTKDGSGQHVPIRKRAPRIRYAFAKTFSQRVAAKLVGDRVFPSFRIVDSPDDQEFIKAVIRESKIKAHIIEPVRRMLAVGSVLVRFYLSGGAIKIEWYSAKYCYPTFQENGELESVRIRYTYEDKEDKDLNGRPKVKWYQLELGMQSEVLYDNPEYKPNVEPEFVEVQSLNHGLGFVQAEWMKTAEIPNSIDGYSINEDILEFIDELNYSLSQSSHAVSYNQDPQLTFNKMDEDEMQNLVRSATKSWNLGREGEAKFLESNLAGVERAIELRDKVRLNIQDIARVVLLDPEKIIGSAQSAKAMEVLHGPMMDLIDELRPQLEKALKNLVLKMAITILFADRQGIPIPLVLPEGWQPQNLNVEIEWPPIFQQTIEDLQKKMAVASSASTSNLISRESLTRWLAKDFGIENIDEELQKIAVQPPPPNPFGGF